MANQDGSRVAFRLTEIERAIQETNAQFDFCPQLIDCREQRLNLFSE